MSTQNTSKYTVTGSFGEVEIEFFRLIADWTKSGNNPGPRQVTYCYLGHKAYYGVATHNPEDLYDQEKGENEALARALETFTREERREFWEEFRRERAIAKGIAAAKELEAIVKATQQKRLSRPDPNEVDIPF